MNGRIYDAKLHRFLQPDNFVQDPSNTQNFNRYAYVLNNPLKYIDSSGEYGENPKGPIDAGPGEWDTDGVKRFWKDVKHAWGEVKHGIDRGINQIKGWFNKSGGDSEPAPNMATNVNINTYTSGGANSFGQSNSSSRFDNSFNQRESSTSSYGTPQYVYYEKQAPTELGMGIFEWVEGGGALKLVKIAKESSLANKTVVIGEDMLNRVIPFAEKNGFKYFKPRGTNPANWMKNQSKWIYRQIKDPTVRIIDIGSKEIEATSKYYMKELEMLKKYLGY